MEASTDYVFGIGVLDSYRIYEHIVRQMKR